MKPTPPRSRSRSSFHLIPRTYTDLLWIIIGFLAGLILGLTLLYFSANNFFQ